MTDLWSFLVHTLNATTAALIILLIKRIFRDKLTPVWHFSVWAVLLAVLLIPKGTIGGFIFINWHGITEFLKTHFLYEYTLSESYAFFPLLTNISLGNIFNILYLAYFAGVIFFLLKYTVSYVRLRLILRKANKPTEAEITHLKEIANRHSLPLCNTVRCNEITTPFISGIFSPVLVLPENEIDEKVFLHELMHLKYKDVLWGIVIAIFRSIHWCNPVLWFIFNKINNDLEELCDSRVLSLLEGEERRSYGNILLSMVNEKYASLPGTSSAANGGKNISSRIKTIARFKQYPDSSTILNICITAVLAVLLLTGNLTLSINADAKGNYSDIKTDYIMAETRTARCYTPAGAIDTYVKAVLQNNGYYRACCASLSEHKALADEMRKNKENGITPLWDSGLEFSPYNGNRSSYSVYNLRENEDKSYFAIIGFEVHSPTQIEGKKLMAYQRIKILKEDGRWIVNPLSGFDTVYSDIDHFGNACFEIPTYCFGGENDEFYAQRLIQHVIVIDSNVKNNANLPDFYAEFSYLYNMEQERIIYKGEEQKSFKILRYGFRKIYEGDEPPYNTSRHGVSSGEDFSDSNEKLLGGGGSGESFTKKGLTLPESVLFEISVNRGAYEQLMLYMEDDLYE